MGFGGESSFLVAKFRTDVSVILGVCTPFWSVVLPLCTWVILYTLGYVGQTVCPVVVGHTVG